MAINLQKGQKISLEKETGSSLTKIFMGLGWDTAQQSSMLGKLFNNNEAIDLDASCLLFNEHGKLIDTVWFRQLRSKDGSIQHSGDNRTGDGDGDDEKIYVSLNKISNDIKSLIFTVSNYTGQDFSRVSNAFCRIVNDVNQLEIARYDLSCQGKHTAMIMAKVYRHNNEWKLHAIGEVGIGKTFDQLLPQIVSYL